VTWSYFARLRSMPAIVVLGFWFVLQFLNGVMAFGIGQVGGVAWFAHVGGFVIGLIAVKLFVPRGARTPAPRGGRYF
jgi:membrane associated rhomboid family serine protease